VRTEAPVQAGAASTGSGSAGNTSVGR